MVQAIESVVGTKVVRYCPAYEEQHRSFASQYWKKRKRTTPEYIYWKFRGTPEDPPSFLLALDGHKIVGQLGFIPCTLMIKGRKVEAQWACDLMVDTLYRGKGIATLLYEFGFKLRPVTLGSDPSPAAAKSMKRAGFLSLQGPTKFLFPMFLGEAARLKEIKSSILDLLPNPFLIFFGVWAKFRRSTQFRRIDSGTYQKTADRHYVESTNSAQVDHSSQTFRDWRFRPVTNYYAGIGTYANERGSIYSLCESPDQIIIAEHWAETVLQRVDLLSDVILKARKQGVRRIKVLAQSGGQTLMMSVLGLVPFSHKD